MVEVSKPQEGLYVYPILQDRPLLDSGDLNRICGYFILWDYQSQVLNSYFLELTLL